MRRKKNEEKKREKWLQGNNYVTHMTNNIFIKYTYACCSVTSHWIQDYTVLIYIYIYLFIFTVLLLPTSYTKDFIWNSNSFIQIITDLIPRFWYWYDANKNMGVLSRSKLRISSKIQRNVSSFAEMMKIIQKEKPDIQTECMSRNTINNTSTSFHIKSW